MTLAGWRLSVDGKPAFQFPAGTALAPGGHLVVGRDRARLAPLTGLPAAAVLGDLQRGLDNGGDDVALFDAGGARVDFIRYDDQPPWPVGADALGAGRGWFPPGEYEKQQHRGRSLERRSFTVAATEPRNWEASALGGGTPGRANGVSGDPPAIVMSHGAGGADGLAVEKGERPVVRATLSRGEVGELSVEYFVDDPARPDDKEPKTSVPMRPSGGEQVAELPALPERSIIRDRILARRGSGPPEPIAPRPGDLADYHATYVQPDPAPPPRSYQLFIAPASWMRMWTNLGPGPNAGCELNPSWDARVPAVVVHDGRVYDVLVRHQGSRYQRRNGFNLPSLPGIGPVPGGKAFSWRLSFPASLEWGRGTNDRRGTVTLNKQHQACPGVLNLLESKLHWAAGMRTQRFRFARLYVNGVYYHYMMEIEVVDEDLLDKTTPPGVAMGDLFKADGAIDDNQGPWGRANFLPMAPNAMVWRAGRWLTATASPTSARATSGRTPRPRVTRSWCGRSRGCARSTTRPRPAPIGGRCGRISRSTSTSPRQSLHRRDVGGVPAGLRSRLRRLQAVEHDDLRRRGGRRPGPGRRRSPSGINAPGTSHLPWANATCPPRSLPPATGWPSATPTCNNSGSAERPGRPPRTVQQMPGESGIAQTGLD